MYQPKTEADRRTILARTHGRCHLCAKKVCINNYGQHGRRGAWEVDHSKAQALGGTHHGNNLFAACISCNRSKGSGCSRKYRNSKGLKLKPVSTPQLKKKRIRNTIVGGFMGGLCGLRLGPVGAILGFVTGAAIGSDVNPD